MKRARLGPTTSTRTKRATCSGGKAQASPDQAGDRRDGERLHERHDRDRAEPVRRRLRGARRPDPCDGGGDQGDHDDFEVLREGDEANVGAIGLRHDDHHRRHPETSPTAAGCRVSCEVGCKIDARRRWPNRAWYGRASRHCEPKAKRPRGRVPEPPPGCFVEPVIGPAVGRTRWLRKDGPVVTDAPLKPSWFETGSGLPGRS